MTSLFANTPHITCGCGFEVVSPDTAHNQEVFDTHTCITDAELTPWYEAVFSFWGVTMLAIVGMVVLGVLAPEVL